MKNLLLLLLFPVGLSAQTINVRLSDGSDNFHNAFWNNWTINVKPDTSGYLIDVIGNTTKIRAVLQAYISIYDNGAGYLAGKSIFPDTVLRRGVYNSGMVNLTLMGMDDSSVYDLSFFASVKGNPSEATSFAIGKQTDTLFADSNISKTALFSGIVSAKGIVVVVMRNTRVADFLNAMQIVGRPKHPTLKAVIRLDSTSIHYPRSFVIANADSSINSIGNQWSISGPSNVIFAPFGDSMYVAGLIPGVYRLKLIVQDTIGNMDSTFAAVTVNGVPACPAPIVCPICPICPAIPAPRTVIGMVKDFFTGVTTITFSDKVTQVIN